MDVAGARAERKVITELVSAFKRVRAGRLAECLYGRM
jgi:hypothetical protein